MRSVLARDVFAGQTCLVTGGGTGIGRCIALELLQAGAKHVVIAARDAKRLESAAAELRRLAAESGATGAVSCSQINIRDEKQVADALSALIETHGRIDCLVNNGGGQFASPAALISPKGFRAVIDTNLNGTWLMCQALYLLTPKARRRGLAIVNVIADYFNGFPGMAHTGAARAGVDNLTRTLSREWGPEGVRVNSVAPGIILSSGVDNYPESIRDTFFANAFKIPLRRAGSEGEISGAVCFLLSPAASYITGATVRVDGGGSLSKAENVVTDMMEDLDTDAPGAPAPPSRAHIGATDAFHINETMRREFLDRVRLVGQMPGEKGKKVSKL